MASVLDDLTTTSPPDPRRWAALGVALLAVFMDLIDITIVVIALPSIQADLGTGFAGLQWVMAAYALSFGVLLITGGRLGDLYGRKRLFLAGVALFTAMSAACALAPGLIALTTARVVQGAAAALMVPQVLAMIQVAFPHEERPKAFGLYGAVNGLAAATAPILGGLLVASDVFGLGWRSVFWINVPVGVVALAAGALLLPESRSDTRRRLDLPGILVVSAGVFALVYPLIQGGELGWPTWGWAAMAAAPLILLGFAVYQRRRERAGGDPLVPVSLFRRGSFATGLLVCLVVFSSVAALFLVLTTQLQTGHGYSALRVGLTFMAWPVGLALSSGVAIRLSRTAGARVIGAGCLILTAAMAALALVTGRSGEPSWPLLVACLFAGGIGFGLVAPILVDIVLGTVPTRDAGAASGVVNTVIQVAGGGGVAVVGALFASSLDRGVDAAASAALWYVVGAFALGGILSVALPRTAEAAGEQ